MTLAGVKIYQRIGRGERELILKLEGKFVL
jgi:hypothetical protein